MPTRKKPLKSAQRKPAAGAGPWDAALSPRRAGEKRYWLVKSEPDTFSFDALLSLPGQTTSWDGVRNFVARNFMRVGMRKGDRVFFYHSSTNPQAIVGICEVAKEAHPDSTAFDAKHHGYDPRSDPADPTWFMVDLHAIERLPRPVTLAEIKRTPALAAMAMLRIGRLSVTPVAPAEWDTIIALSRTTTA
ncbi:MAG: hypothetical protein MNPFHGCM_02989 [Gemmatimonadaceae bacterium]|nr:hypothetical protein [Gemmatimonadaceae bacterium]